MESLDLFLYSLYVLGFIIQCATFFCILSLYERKL